MDIEDPLDELREMGSWPRTAEVLMIDEEPSDDEVVACDTVLPELIAVAADEID